MLLSALHAGSYRCLPLQKCSKRGVQAGDNGASSLVFCIGGPYGHAASIRDRADSVISVSSLVLNHQVRSLQPSPNALQMQTNFACLNGVHHTGCCCCPAGSFVSCSHHSERRSISSLSVHVCILEHDMWVHFVIY